MRKIADVVTVFENRRFDEALWPSEDFPVTGFVFTLAALRDVHISKVEINKLLGYKPRYTWQNNRLLSEDRSRRLASLISGHRGRP